MKVRIIKAELESYWYAECIGDVFEVVKTSGKHYPIEVVIGSAKVSTNMGIAKGDYKIYREPKKIDWRKIEIEALKDSMLYKIQSRKYKPKNKKWKEELVFQEEETKEPSQ